MNSSTTYNTQTCWYGEDNSLEGWYGEQDINYYVYIDGAGTQHPFSVSYSTIYHDDCASDVGTSWGTSTGYASDGSGYYIDITNINSPQIWSAGSGKVDVTNGILTDRNGNTSGAGGDSAGHTFTIDWVSGTSTMEYHYTDASGTDRKYSVKYQNYSVMTNFGCSGVAE
jgi:hypothetical protein